jgi:serine protease Do
MHATFTHLIGPNKGERVRFDDARISIGRAPDNALCMGDAARRVSSHHAEVIRRGDNYLLRDLGSTNGTMINGRRVVVSELGHDDLIEFGAGGPLLRFGVEPDSTEDQVETIAERLRDPSGSLAKADASPRLAQGLRNNAVLLAALVAAMLVGAVGGIVGASRLRAIDPERVNVAEVAEENVPAVVFIRTEFELLDSNGQVTTSEARTGSGFVASDSGLIITNRHLVRDWEYNASTPGLTGRVTKIEVTLPHRKSGDAIPAEIYKLGVGATDVAILKINSPGAPPVRGFEADIEHTNQGDEVVVIGYPLGLDLLHKTNDVTVDPSVSSGIVSRVGHDYIQLNLRAYRGNSGGPVLNRKGDVIGILTAKLGDAQDITLCTPIGAALTLINSAIPHSEERK